VALASAQEVPPGMCSIRFRERASLAESVAALARHAWQDPVPLQIQEYRRCELESHASPASTSEQQAAVDKVMPDDSPACKSPAVDWALGDAPCPSNRQGLGFRV
jgi:hypothetical protein